jgi:tetratricopeptide (TPR) repeat protein
VEIFERIADGLHIPGAMLDLAPRPWERGHTSSGQPAAEANIGPVSQDGDSSVLRREFMKLGAGIAVTTVAASPSGTAGNRVGSSIVGELRSNMVRLRRLDDHLGGADTYHLYRAELDKTARVLKTGSFSLSTQRELMTLYAEQAQQTGWAAFDAGWHDNATKLYERSFEVAKEANNSELAGNAHALRAYQLLSLGSVDAAVTSTDRSCAIADHTAIPEVRSLLFQRGAWTYAVANQAEQVSQALGEAEGALTHASAGRSPDWAAWAHNPTELQIIAGRCWTVLRRPLRAVPALESALAEYGDSHARDKALYLSWLADAYLQAGEVEPATTAVERALDLSAGIASSRPQRRVSEVMDRLAEFDTTPGVAELLSRRPVDPVQVRR